jgi:hypothetical protein
VTIEKDSMIRQLQNLESKVSSNYNTITRIEENHKSLVISFSELRKEMIKRPTFESQKLAEIRITTKLQEQQVKNEQK